MKEVMVNTQISLRTRPEKLFIAIAAAIAVVFMVYGLIILEGEHPEVENIAPAPAIPTQIANR